MNELKPRVVSFVLLAESLRSLPTLLKDCFIDPWVASYQIGFGPPLVRSSERIRERLKVARSAFDKLDGYLEVCFLNAEEQKRLALLHRRLTVRRLGPVEAEALDEVSGQVLDLQVRLHTPDAAPTEVGKSMKEVEVDPIPKNISFQDMTGRFVVRLNDPRGERLLHNDVVSKHVSDADLDHALAVELRVPAPRQQVFQKWLEKMEEESEFSVVSLGEPMAHARVLRDGARS